jgi:hypothetical protein
MSERRREREKAPGILVRRRMMKGVSKGRRKGFELR